MGLESGIDKEVFSLDCYNLLFDSSLFTIQKVCLAIFIMQKQWNMEIGLLQIGYFQHNHDYGTVENLAKLFLALSLQLRLWYHPELATCESLNQLCKHISEVQETLPRVFMVATERGREDSNFFHRSTQHILVNALRMKR